MNKDQFIQTLGSGAGAMGVKLSGEMLEKFFLYFTELKRWNRNVNLVSRKEPDWVRAHFLDSLAPLGMGLVPKDGRAVDLGAGAGFPGVPLGLVSAGLFLDLAEASGKKCVWLKHLLRILGMEQCTVLEGRFGALLDQGAAGIYDLAVSRAAAQPAKVVKEARSFMRPGGRLLIYTTNNLAGKSMGKIHPYAIPGSKIPSVIWEVTF